MAADVDECMELAIIRHEEGLAIEVHDGDAAALGETEGVEAAEACPLVTKHIALALKHRRVDVVLAGEGCLHGSILPYVAAHRPSDG